jgi:hypothetical protein
MSARALLRNIAGDYDDSDKYDNYDDDDEDEYSDEEEEFDDTPTTPTTPTTIAVVIDSNNNTRSSAAAAASAARQEELRRERRAVARECGELQRGELAQVLEVRAWQTRVHVAEAADSRRLTVDGAWWWLDVTTGPLYPLRESADVRIRFAPTTAFPTPPSATIDSRATFDAMRERQFRACVAAVLSARAQQLALEPLIDACDAFQPTLAADVAAPAAVTRSFDLVQLFAPPPAGDEVEFLGSLARVTPLRVQASPHFVSGNSATVIGTQLFDVGGRASGGGVLAPLPPLVRVLDLASGAWFYPELIGRHPVPVRAHWQSAQPHDGVVAHHAAVRVGGRLYVFGGRAEDTVGREYAVLNVDTFEWTFVPGAFSRVHARMTATRVGHEIWIVGGAVADSKHALFNTCGRYLFVLDVRTHEFRAAPCPCRGAPARRGGGAPSACEHCRGSGQTHNLAVALEEAMAALPPIREHTATRVGRFLFVHGGVQNGGTVSNASYVIDTAEPACYAVGLDQARPRCGHAALRVNQRFVACVGGRSFNDAPVAPIDLFDLATKTWLSRSAPDVTCRDGGAALPFGDGRILHVFGHRDVRKPGPRNAITSERFGVPPMLIDVGLPQAAPPRALPKSMLAALESGAHSDVSWRSFRLHRVVLQARCPHLLALIDGGGAELAELSDAALGAALRYCYGGGAPLVDVEPTVRATLANLLRLPQLAAATDGDSADDNGEALAASFGELFDDDARRERFADLTFVCGGVRLRAHSVFVWRAAHFRMVLESGMREAATHEIAIDDVDAATVRALVRFLYTEAVSCPAERAVELLALADRFTLDSLKAHVEGQIESFYDWSEIDNVVDLIDVAQRYTAPHLLRIAKGVLLSDFDRRAALQFVAEHTDTVSQATIQLVRTWFN